MSTTDLTGDMMSVMKGPVYIECDHCGRWDEDAGRWSAADTRLVLRRKGWDTNLPGGRDLCQVCKGLG